MRLQRGEWEQVVAAATRAPSIHNTQPWLFTASDDVLEVFTDPSRALPVLDPSGRQRVISCGVAVEFAAVALRVAGRDAQVALPDPTAPDHRRGPRPVGRHRTPAHRAALRSSRGRSPDD